MTSPDLPRSALLSRRAILLGGLGVASAAALTACTGSPDSPGGMPMRTVGPPTPTSAAPGQRTVAQTLTARTTTLDLGVRAVSTWAYGETAPGPLVRATAGDFLRLTLVNQLPAESTIHWHGIRLPNREDGVPYLVQPPVEPGCSVRERLTLPAPSNQLSFNTSSSAMLLSPSASTIGV